MLVRLYIEPPRQRQIRDVPHGGLLTEVTAGDPVCRGSWAGFPPVPCTFAQASDGLVARPLAREPHKFDRTARTVVIEGTAHLSTGVPAPPAPPRTTHASIPLACGAKRAPGAGSAQRTTCAANGRYLATQAPVCRYFTAHTHTHSSTTCIGTAHATERVAVHTSHQYAVSVRSAYTR